MIRRVNVRSIFIGILMLIILHESLSREQKLLINYEQNINIFIKGLVHHNFRNCTSIVLEDSLQYEENLDHLWNELGTGKYFIRITNSSKNPDFTFKLSSVKRYSKSCMVAIIIMNRIDTEAVVNIREIIAPKFMPLIRKDKDHFIYVAPQKFHGKLLLMNELPHRTKFKLAVGLKEGGGSLVASTVDFFGGPNGSPSLIEFVTNEFENINFFPDFLWNLRGAKLEIVLPVTRSFVEADPAIPINNGIRGRWLYLFEEYLMPKFNFTYHMFLSTDENGVIGLGATGYQLKNGTWIGMTGDLLYGRADLGLAFANTPKRDYYIGFTDTHFDFGCLTFVTGQPRKIFSTNAIFWPFSIGSWLCIIGSCGIGLLFLILMEASIRVTKMEDFSLTFTSQVRLLLAPFIEQDYTLTPYSTSLRSFLSYWSFFAIVITTLYRSKLVTLLAFPVVDKLPETFEDLAFSDFQIGFMKHGDSALNTLKASTDPVYVTLVKKMEIMEGVGLECLENSVKFGKFACIAYDFDVVYLKERNLTDEDARKFVIATRGQTYNVFLGIGTEAYSKYRINFGKVLAYTTPANLNQVWDKMDMYRNIRQVKRKWWRDTNQTDKFLASNVNQEGSDEDLTLRHIQGIFYIFFGSVMLSMILFAVECVRFHYCRKTIK